MEFQISIDQFEGPLDLMLHLIKTNKLDLFDLDLHILANQYIAYIQQMRELKLEIASEYLSELASLIEYISKKLLPREEVEVKEEYEEDQREKLVSRLLEYQKYKEASSQLKIQYEHRQRQFERASASLIETWRIPKEEGALDHQNIYLLSKAFHTVLKRQAILKAYQTQVNVKEISIEERNVQILDRMKMSEDGVLSFEQLVRECGSLYMIIISFLSILDLIHKRSIAYQIEENEHIILYRKDQKHV